MVDAVVTRASRDAELSWTLAAAVSGESRVELRRQASAGGVVGDDDDDDDDGRNSAAFGCCLSKSDRPGRPATRLPVDPMPFFFLFCGWLAHRLAPAAVGSENRVKKGGSSAAAAAAAQSKYLRSPILTRARLSLGCLEARKRRLRKVGAKNTVKTHSSRR
ncbi:hypothetical protein L1887_48983 [Cichorium endivia]|nr:hypothetical protein L1887_48983 [Cichorium endivia]